MSVQLNEKQKLEDFKSAQKYYSKLRYCVDELEDAIFIKKPSSINKSPYLCDIYLKKDSQKVVTGWLAQLDGNKQIKKDTEVKVIKKSTAKSQYQVLFHKQEEVIVGSAPKIAEEQFGFFFQDFIIQKQRTLGFNECLMQFEDQVNKQQIKKYGKLMFDFFLQQSQKDKTGKEIISQVYLEIKNVIIVQERTAKFPINDSPKKKLGKYRVISIRCIKQLFFIMKCLQWQITKREEERVKFAFIFMINREDVDQFQASDPLFSDLLYNCLLLGCEVIAYSIKWKFSEKNQKQIGISRINKVVPIIFKSQNKEYVYKPYKKINKEFHKMELIKVDEYNILENILKQQ